MANDDDLDERAEQKNFLISSRQNIIWTAIGVTKDGPSSGHLEDAATGDLLSKESSGTWLLEISEIRGTRKTRNFKIAFKSKDEADEWFYRYRDGSFAPERPPFSEISDRYLLFIQELLNNSEVNKSDIFGTITPQELPRQVLEKVDILGSDGKTSQEVLDLIGGDRIHSIKERFPRSWSYVVEMEYVMRCLPVGSAAFVAASVRYLHFVTKEKEVSGYLLRELQEICRDADNAFLKEIKRQHNSGASGTEGTKAIIREDQTLLVARMSYLMKYPKKLPSDRPLSALRLASDAAKYLGSKGNKRWKKISQRVLDNHLSAIRSAEAGKLLKRKLEKIEKTLENLYKT